MQPTRIILAEASGLLRDIIVGSIATRRDMELVAEVSHRSELIELVRRATADAIVMGHSGAGQSFFAHQLLAVYPHLKLVVVTCDGRKSYLYEVRPQEVEVGEASVTELLDALKSPPVT